MAGIYLHIPFCSQKCHYCNFFSLASLKNTSAFVAAICNEIKLQHNYLGNRVISSIYYGGGTPSILKASELKLISDTLFSNFNIKADAEITLEANPDDLNTEKLKSLSDSKINRLSIGLQSFYNEDLKFLNRSHTSTQAEKAISDAQDSGLTNISIDLIYGIPTLTNPNWIYNINKAIDSGVQHISAYSLTVEPKTAYDLLIKKGKTIAPDEEKAIKQFEILMEIMQKNGYIHYEISNFCKQGFFSKHNSSYWKQEPYLGLGPSAHSYNQKSRQWNISSLTKYIQEIENGNIPFESEDLSPVQKYNEYILTGLRTVWGINADEIKIKFGNNYHIHFLNSIQNYLNNKTVELNSGNYTLTFKGKLLADAIASELFYE